MMNKIIITKQRIITITTTMALLLLVNQILIYLTSLNSRLQIKFLRRLKQLNGKMLRRVITAVCASNCMKL